MNASLRFFDADERVGILRVHPDGVTYPGAFTWSVVVTARGTAAHIHAALRPPSKAERDAAKAALLAAGFAAVTWERRATDSGALRRKTRVAYRRSTD